MMQNVHELEHDAAMKIYGLNSPEEKKLSDAMQKRAEDDHYNQLFGREEE